MDIQKVRIIWNVLMIYNKARTHNTGLVKVAFQSSEYTFTMKIATFTKPKTLMRCATVEL